MPSRCSSGFLYRTISGADIAQEEILAYQLLYVVAATVRFLIAAIQFLMLARAIISWLPFEEDHPLVNFLYSVTEPVIMPVRAVIDRLGLFEGMPIDMSFLITFMLLSILELFL